MIWVINTNSNHCRIYHYEKRELKLLKEIEHPEIRHKKSDYLTSDKPGHYQTNHGAHSAYQPRHDPKEVEIDKFARTLAKELEHEANTHAYEKLILIASPHMTGLLTQHFSKQVKERISHHVQKDLMHLPETELLGYINEQIKYPE